MSVGLSTATIAAIGLGVTAIGVGVTAYNNKKNRDLAQEAFMKRAKNNSLATSGKYEPIAAE